MSLINELRRDPRLSDVPQEDLVEALMQEPEFQHLPPSIARASITGQSAMAEDERRGFLAGVRSGLHNLGAAAGGLTALLGEKTKSDALYGAGMATYDSQMEKAVDYDLGYGITDFFSPSEDMQREPSWGEYAAYQVGAFLPSTVISMGTGWIGGAVAKGATGLATRGATEAARRGAVAKGAAEAARKTTMARAGQLGQAGGAWAGSAGQYAGSLYGDLGDADVSLIGAAVGGALDSMFPAFMLRTLSPAKRAAFKGDISEGVGRKALEKAAERGILKNIAVRGAQGGGTEGVTEALQQLVEQEARHYVETNGESLINNYGEIDWRGVLDGWGAGTVGGGGQAAPAGVVDSSRARGELRRQEVIEQARQQAAEEGGDALDQTMAAQQAEAAAAPSVEQADPAQAAEVGNRIQLAMGELDDLQNLAKGSSYQGQTRLNNIKRLLDRAEQAYSEGRTAQANRLTIRAESIAGNLRAALSQQGTAERPAVVEGNLRAALSQQGTAERPAVVEGEVVDDRVSGLLGMDHRRLPPGRDPDAMAGESPQQFEARQRVREEQEAAMRGNRLGQDGVIYGEGETLGQRRALGRERTRASFEDQQGREPYWGREGEYLGPDPLPAGPAREGEVYDGQTIRRPARIDGRGTPRLADDGTIYGEGPVAGNANTGLDQPFSGARFTDTGSRDAAEAQRARQQAQVDQAADASRTRGRSETTHLPDNTPISTRFRVVDADELTVSNTPDGRINPVYPRELQPRDRTGANSRVQVRNIAARLNPERLGSSADAGSGAPIIGPDGVVESGNGRAMAIATAYQQDSERAQAYRDFVRREAAEQGMDPEAIDAMGQPVLVRERTTDVDRADFARRANESQVAGMTAYEQAQSDADALSADDVRAWAPDRSGDPLAASNRDFQRRFVQRLGNNEAARYTTRDGQASPELGARMQRALFAKAYADADVVEMVTEQGDQMRNLTAALQVAAPDLAAARETGSREALQAIDTINDAVRIVRRARQDGIGVRELVRQADAFSEPVPETTALLAVMIDNNMRSRRALAEAMRYIGQAVRSRAESERSGELFENTTTTEDVFDAAFQGEGPDQRAGQQAPQGAVQSGAERGEQAPAQGRQADDSARAEAVGEQAEVAEAEGEPLLATYDEQELVDRDQAQQQAEQAEAEQRRQEAERAQADAEVDDFRLSGSDRPADVMAAGGQQDLMGAQPTERIGVAEQMRERTGPFNEESGISLEPTPQQVSDQVETLSRARMGRAAERRAIANQVARRDELVRQASEQMARAQTLLDNAAQRRRQEGGSATTAQNDIRAGNEAMDQAKTTFREAVETDAFIRALEQRASVAADERQGGIRPAAQDETTRFSLAPATDSDAFKRWFGESKVVDEKGDPLVVYHGTSATDIESFTPRQTSSGKSGDEVINQFRAAKEDGRPFPLLTFRSGSFFAPDPDFASNYATENQGVVYPVYVKAESPAYIQNGRLAAERPKQTPDALFVLDNNGNVAEIAVIDPTQIKSAFNRGAFGPDNPDIRYALSEQTAGQLAASLRDEFLGLKLFIRERDGTATIDRIELPPDQREQGAGTQVMERIIEWADASGKTLALTPSGDFGGSPRRLAGFYKRFGFKENKGRSRDQSISETMFREPAAPRYAFAGERDSALRADVLTSTFSSLEGLGDVEVVQSTSRLPASVLDSMAAQGISGRDVRGVYVGDKMYVVADNIASIEEGVRTAVHEAVGHKGIRGVLGKQLEPVMLGLYRSLPNSKAGREALREVLDAYPHLDPSKREDRIVIGEEMVAHLLEKGHRPKAWQRAVARIRELLRRAFPSVSWTYTDVLLLGEKSRDYLRRRQGGDQGSAGESRFSRAAPTDSAAFKRWFGDSEVVDEDGEPLVVYHGTQGDFYEFDPNKRGSVWGDEASKAGFFFAESREAAEFFAGRADGDRIIDAYIKIENPYVIEDSDIERFENEWLEELSESDPAEYEFQISTKSYQNTDDISPALERAIQEGMSSPRHDGVIVDLEGDERWYIASNPNQVKSASENVGDFDPDNNDIRFSLRGKKRTPFEDQFDDFGDADRAAAGKIGSRTPPERAMEWFKEKADRAGLKIRQGMVDKVAALKEMDERLYGESALGENIARSSWVLARMSNAASGALHAMMHNGRIQLDAKERVVTLQDGDAKGLGEVLGRLGSGAEIERFMGWIAGNRAAKLAGEGRENLFDMDDIDAMKSWNRGTMADGRSREAVYQEVFDEFQTYRDDVLAVAEQSGIISKDQREMWRDEFYVPFYRLAEDDNNVGMQLATSGLSRQQAYRKLKGGTQNLNDLLQNTMLNFNHLLDASLKNQAAAQAVENAKALGMAEKVPESGRDTSKSTFVMEGGKKAYYEIDDPLVFQALTALASPGMNSTAMRTMRKFKRVFTNLVTTTPQFMVANLIRDSLQAVATNNVSKNAFKNVISGTGKYRDERLRAEMLASGASFNFGHLYGNNPDEMRAQLTRHMRNAELVDGPYMVPSLLRAGWERWNAINNATENINRAAIYSQNSEQGKLAAAFEARDLIDFSAHGAWPAVRILIDIVPFLNARIQGLDKIYRSGVKPGASVVAEAFGYGKAGVSDKQAAARFWTVTGALALATIALYLNNKDDEEYQKLEEWQKDTYWFFRAGDKAFFIPKPFEVGAMATMAERITEQFVDDKATGELFRQRMWQMMTETFSFSPVPQMMQPALDVYANKDSFTGRPIEGMGMDRLSPELRKRGSTTKTAEWISAGLNKTVGAIGSPDDNPLALSPVQVDHLIGGYLGQVGAWVAGSGDVAWRVATGETSPARHWYEYQPIRRFYRDLGDEDFYTRYGTVFYEGLREAGRAYSDVRELREQGGIQEAMARAESDRELLALRKGLNRAQSKLRKVNQQMDIIRRSSLSAAVKRQRLDRLRAVKNQLQEAWGKRLIDLKAG